MLHYFFKSLLIGFSLASVIGPISILCVKQTLANGYKAGFVATLGATTAEIFYAGVAAFGLTMISAFLIEQQFYLRIIGGIFLLYLGMKTVISKVAQVSDENIKKHNLWKSYFTITALTVSNPLTIILFLSVFTSLGMAQEGLANPFFIVAGVGLGSVLAYSLLIVAVVVLKKKASQRALEIVHTISGFVIVGFALYAFFGAYNMIYS